MKPLIVANWKMNPQKLTEAKKLFDSIKKRIRRIKNIKVVICPPFVFLPILKSRMHNLKIGAQDCFWENPATGEGAYTGEVSPQMLRNLDVKYVIIGHSERRRYKKETNEMINKKIKAALSLGLKPIFCIGEIGQDHNLTTTSSGSPFGQWAPKNKGQGLKVLNSQISKGLKGIKEKEAKKIIIAYEPIWAIGTGKPCDVNTVLSQSLIIRGVIKKMFSPFLSRQVPILYGGSVTSENAAEFIIKAKMSGLLVGGASLKAREFSQIVKAVDRT